MLAVLNLFRLKPLIAPSRLDTLVKNHFPILKTEVIHELFRGLSLALTTE